MSSIDDDADSVMRAVAAAPERPPPVRVLTALVVRAIDGVDLAAHARDVAALAQPFGGEVTERDDGAIVISWTGTTSQPADTAALCALALRDGFAWARMALATSSGEPVGLLAHGSIAGRAAALVDQMADAIRLDPVTAGLLAGRFEIVNDAAGPLLVGKSLTSTFPPDPSQPSPIEIDRTVGNYRIERRLGGGGMGVVYLAEHVTLGRKAVVKFVHPEYSRSPEFVRRFFTEAKTAATIRHPGIVDVFDYGQDSHGNSYIVMELLEGESMRDLLARERTLRIELAVALGLQLASALSAAHTRGVVHRDLKPDNVFIVNAPDLPSRIRAKVLDFGLAKVTNVPEGMGITRSGALLGTPLYMSPEQCRTSVAVDHRTDVYSLGCMLFEMVAGRPPFIDNTVGDLIAAHIAKPAPSLRTFHPEISEALERLVATTLAKDPADRQQTMEELAAELGTITDHLAAATPPRTAERPAVMAPTIQGVPSPVLVTPPPAIQPDAVTPSPVTVAASPAAKKTVEPPRARRSPLIWIAAVLVVLAGAAVVWQLALTRATTEPPPAIGDGAIAVLDPFAGTGTPTDQLWLATALGEIVRTELQASGRVRIAPGADVARMKADVGIVAGETLSAGKLAKVRADLSADFVVASTYATTSDEVAITATIYDATSGAVVGSATASGTMTTLADTGGRVAREIERVLGIEQTTPTPVAPVLPGKPAAARYYAEGLAKLRGFELVQARELLERAATEAPDDPLVHAALSDVWRELGYDAKAAAEARLAYDRGSALSRENRLAIEARYRVTTAQWDQAIDAYRTLFEFFPRLDYGLALADAQTRAGDAKSAYATLDTLRKMPQLGNDPRIELADADAAESADDTERERVHAERAVTLARSRGARVLLAKAQFRHGWALWTLGRDAEAKLAYDEAKQIFTELHDRSGLARCLNNIGLAAHRDRREGDAARAFEDALKLATEIGDTTAQAWVLQNWSFMLIDQGELKRALELSNQKLELGGARGDSRASQAAAHANVAEILRLRGDLPGARTHAQTAVDLLRGVDERLFAAFTADQLGEIDRAEGDLAGARKQLEQAIRWASDAKHRMIAAESRMSLARTELDAGHPADAEPLARAAIDDLRAAKDTRLHACAASLLATALLAKDRATDASRELAGASPAIASMACQLDHELATARVIAGDSAQREPAIIALKAVGARAAKHGFVQRELEIRLALVQVGADDPRTLAKDATVKGFKQIARRATELAKKR